MSLVIYALDKAIEFLESHGMTKEEATRKIIEHVLKWERNMKAR